MFQSNEFFRPYGWPRVRSGNIKIYLESNSKLKGKYLVCENGMFVKYYLNCDIFGGVISFHTRSNVINCTYSAVNVSHHREIFLVSTMLKVTELFRFLCWNWQPCICRIGTFRISRNGSRRSSGVLKWDHVVYEFLVLQVAELQKLNIFLISSMFHIYIWGPTIVINFQILYKINAGT